MSTLRTDTLKNTADTFTIPVNELSNKVELANTSDATKGAALIGFDGTTLAQKFKDVVSRTVDSITALKAIDKTKYTKVFVTGYYVAGDGGGGQYYFDAADTTSLDNQGTIIVATDGGRWKLLHTSSVSVRQFGAKADDATAGATNTTAFQKAMDTVGSVYVPGGYYTISGVLNWRSGLFMFGDNPGGATADAQALPGAARLLFTTAGVTCFGQANPTIAVQHGGITNISWETATRDFLLDFNGTLGFTFSGIRAETSKVNGAGFRSTQIGTDPTWLNHCSDIEIRILDGSTGYNWDVDWSDSDVTLFAFTGGKGARDRGPGNVAYSDGIFDRANSTGAGLTLSGSPTSNKQVVISNSKFDDNEGYGMIWDASANTTGVFSPTVTGCVFRNPSVASTYDVLIINIANGSQPIMSGGTIVGNTFSQTTRTPFNIDETTWAGVTYGPNRYPDNFATPFPPNTRFKGTYIGRNGLTIPAGPAIVRSDQTIRGHANVGFFSTFTTGDAGFIAGTGAGGVPFVGASRTEAGASSNLNIVTDTQARFIFAGNGTAMYPNTDNVMSLGLSSNRMTIIYATTGTINTSDAREKTEVRGFTSDEINASKQLAKEIGVYKWLSAVSEKGADARNHIGLTVQRAIEIMTANNLNPFAYGFICYDEWEESDSVAAGNRYGFRVDELTLFIARGFEARLAALEAI